MDWLSDGERERIAELLAEGAPFWRLRQEVPRSRHSIRRAVRRLRQLPKVEPVRSRLHLSLAEREEISRGIAAGESLRCVAARLGRSPSTVSREVTRHGGRDRYRASVADRAAVANMRRPKVAKLARCSRLRAVVEAQARAALVSAADRGLAVRGVPRRSGDAGVARDDLPVAVRAGPRRAPQGTDPLSADASQRAPARRQTRTQRPRPDPSDGQHP